MIEVIPENTGEFNEMELKGTYCIARHLRKDKTQVRQATKCVYSGLITDMENESHSTSLILRVIRIEKTARVRGNSKRAGAKCEGLQSWWEI